MKMAQLFTGLGTCCEISGFELSHQVVDGLLGPDDVGERRRLVAILGNDSNPAVVRKIWKPENEDELGEQNTWAAGLMN